MAAKPTSLFSAAAALLAALARHTGAAADRPEPVLTAAVEAAGSEHERREYVAQSVAACRWGHAVGLVATVVVCGTAVTIAALAARHG